MKNYFILGLMIFVGLKSMATNIQNINTLIPVAGINFKSTGEFQMTNQLALSMISDSTVKIYAKAGDLVQASYSAATNKIPERISFKNGDNDTLYVEFDSAGYISGLRKCENKSCSVVSKDYCLFVYSQLRIKTSAELAKKITDHTVFARIEPSDDLPQLAKIFYQGRDFMKPINDSAGVENLKKLSKNWNVSAAQSYTAQFQDLNSPAALNRTVDQKLAHLNRVAQMCKAIFPKGINQPEEINIHKTGAPHRS